MGGKTYDSPRTRTWMHAHRSAILIDYHDQVAFVMQQDNIQGNDKRRCQHDGDCDLRGFYHGDGEVKEEQA